MNSCSSHPNHHIFHPSFEALKWVSVFCCWTKISPYHLRSPKITLVVVCFFVLVTRVRVGRKKTLGEYHDLERMSLKFFRIQWSNGHAICILFFCGQLGLNSKHVSVRRWIFIPRSVESQGILHHDLKGTGLGLGWRIFWSKSAAWEVGNYMSMLSTRHVEQMRPARKSSKGDTNWWMMSMNTWWISLWWMIINDKWLWWNDEG